MSFELLPQYVYRIKRTVNNHVIYDNAVLTRGQFNTAGTGSFIGFSHTLPHADVYLLCQCQKADCDNRPFWDSLENIEESSPSNCEICESPVAICIYKKRSAGTTGKS